jgi:hypothetical protein
LSIRFNAALKQSVALFELAGRHASAIEGMGNLQERAGSAHHNPPGKQ